MHLSNTAGKILVITVLTVCLLPGIALGETQLGDELAVYAGVVVSNNPAFDSVAMVEFPFSINRHEYSFFVPDSVDGGLFARVFAQVDILNAAGYAVDSVATYFSLKVSSPEEAALPDYRVFNKLSLTIEPGIYAARVTVIDVVSKKKGEFFLERVEVEPNVIDRIAIGGARIAYDVRYVGEDDTRYNPRLRKNGFHVVPNPVSVFTPTDTILYVYGEIYNLKYSPGNVTEYQLAVATLDEKDSLYEVYGSRVTDKPGESAVITESIDIGEFALGSYKVRFIATDLELGQADTVLIPFYIVSPQAVLSAAARQQAVEYDYGDLAVEDHVRMVKHLLVPEQLKILNALGDVGKMNYLDQYWKEHDVDPTTPEVENRYDMIDRFKYANEFFSADFAGTDGWSTDRGRIFLTYGAWDERDQNTAPRQGNAYEVWYYRSISEGKLFVFEDWTGNDDYRLVHSTVYGEVYSREWQERIDQGFVDTPD